MNPFRIAALAGLLGFALASATAAQGLGDTAARERAKRAAKAQEQKKQPSKVFTNDDLAEGRPPGAKDEDGGENENQSPLPRSEEDSAPSSSSGDPLADERPLLDAVSAAQQGVTAAETKVRQLSEKLNPMSVSYIYGAGGSNDANEELRVRAELREAESQLQTARQTLVQANKDLQDQRRGRPRRSEER
jgi:hypothetical protein